MDGERKYEALMSFILTELSQPTLANIRAAANNRMDAIAAMVERNPLTPASATEAVTEDLLNRLDDYL